MAEVILMPRLSDTMTEGVIAAWHKKVGDKVKKGDLLADIETDKATMELESYKDGTLLHVGGDKGSKIQVDQLLAILGNPGEDISQLVKGGGEQKNKEQGMKKEEPKANAEPQKANDKPQTSSMDLSKMDEVVLMPRLSDTMTEGVIASWHKNVGDAVKKGDVLADIETDKATMELESYKNGKLLYQGAKQGEKIAVNDLLCVIGEEGKVDVNAIVAAAKGGQQGGSKEAVSADQSQQSTQQSGSSAPSAAQSTNQTVTPSTTDGRVKASPLAKKMAKEKGIDLSQVQGSGDNGRITKSDIDNFKPSVQPTASGQQQPAAQPAVAGQEGYRDMDNSQMRKVIAKRLGESKFSAPHFYLTMEINMDNAMAARAQMNEVSDVKISFNDMVVKAVAMALRKHPAVNSSWMGDFIRQYQHVHIGVAVAIEEGLIVPVIRFADQKPLSQIAAESKELAGKARNKKLQPNEFTGNTFTISNLGMMDIEEFTAIINPPDSAILAVGRIKEVVVRKKGAETSNESFTVTNVMKVTMSCDHRSVDGAVGASFLQTFKKYMENPVTMLV